MWWSWPYLLVLPSCVLCESCSLLWKGKGLENFMPHKSTHLFFLQRGAWVCESVLSHCTGKPCPTVSLKTTRENSVVLLAVSCHLLSRPSSCRADVLVSSLWPCSVFCCYSLFFSLHACFFFTTFFWLLGEGSQ